MLGLARDVAERVGVILVTLVVLVHGAYEGLQIERFTVDVWGFFVQIVAIDAITATLAFSGFVLLSGALLTLEVHRRRDLDRSLTSGPRLAAIVPAYGDADVLDESVSTLLASSYEDLTVAIVTEPGDEETQARARELAEHPDVRFLENRYQGSKAGAINDAVDRLDADHFAVFDADERVDPDFLPAAMHALVREERDVFQARRVPRVTGAVEAIAYCERLLFHAGTKPLEWFGFTYCRSSSVAFTREAFAAVDGLDDMLTEDVDFSHKCYRAGLDVAQSRAITNEMEAPHTFADLWGQRKRWRMGNVEVLVKGLTGGYDHGGLRGLASTFRMATNLLAGPLVLALAAKVLLLLAVDLEMFFGLPFAAVGLTALPVLVRDGLEGHIVETSPALAFIVLVYPAFGLLTIRSVFAYALSWDGEWYQVEKTGS